MRPRDRIAARRLYLVCDARGGGRQLRGFLDAALRGGVDVVQLRDKALDDDGLLEAAATFRAAADAHGALFVLNDRPDLVEACGADGVHVGQDDATPAAARALVGRVLLAQLEDVHAVRERRREHVRERPAAGAGPADEVQAGGLEIPH